MKENQHRVFACADNRTDKLTWNAGPAPQLATRLANCADLLHLLDHPASSTYPMATPTVQFDKYKCPCFKCCSVKDKSRRTIRIHFKENLAHLSKLRSSGGDLDTLEFVENCHYELTQLLSSLAEDSQATRPPVSPYPDGKSLVFNVFNHILIGFDLADAPIDPPPFSGGVSRDEDAMIVDDNSK